MSLHSSILVGNAVWHSPACMLPGWPSSRGPWWMGCQTQCVQGGWAGQLRSYLASLPIVVTERKMQQLAGILQAVVRGHATLTLAGQKGRLVNVGEFLARASVGAHRMARCMAPVVAIHGDWSAVLTCTRSALKGSVAAANGQRRGLFCVGSVHKRWARPLGAHESLDARLRA